MLKNKLTIILLITLVTILLITGIIFFISNFKNEQEKYFPVFNNYFQHDAITSLKDEYKLDDKKPTIVFFHSKTCRSCYEFMPVYKQLLKKYSKTYNFALLDVDDTANIPLIRGNVGGIPCLYIFDPYIGNKIHLSLSGIGTISNLEYEIDRYTRIRTYIDLEKAHTEHLKLMEEYGKTVNAKSSKK